MMQRWLITYLLWLVCLLPSMSCAHHLLSITPTVPFPATVHVLSSSTATYTITNLASQITVIPVDQSILPCDKGMQIISNSCGVPLAPGHSCQLILSLNAPATPQVLNGQIRMWAKPSADGVRLRFSINVIAPQQFTLTPLAGANGNINPNTPQIVDRGSNATFTAIPNTGFAVSQWFLDGFPIQTGGTTFTLTNITANHTINVTFKVQQFTVTPEAGSGGTISPATPQTVNFGNSLTFTATPTTPGFVVNQWFLDGLLVQGGGTTYTLNNITADHIVNVTFVLAPLLTVGATYQNFNIDQIPVAYTSSDGGDTWSLSPSFNLGAALPLKSLFGVSCTGTPGTTCVGVGDALDGISVQSPLIYTTTDGGVTWSAPIETPTLTYPGTANNGQLFSVTCENSNCLTVGQAFVGAPGTQTQPLAYTSSDGGSTWSAPKTFVLPQARAGLSAVSCVADACAAVGFSSAAVIPIPTAYTSTDRGNTWSQASTQPGGVGSGELLGISCVGRNCVAVGGAGNNPVAYTSTNNGVDWSSPIILPITTNLGTLYSVACVDTHCIAVGDQTVTISSTTTPLGYISNDSGASWTPLAPGTFTPPSGQPEGSLFSVTCTDVNCIAVGVSQNAGGSISLPLAYKTTDGGTTWNLLPTFHIPSPNFQGDLFGVVSGSGAGFSNPPV